MAVFNNIYPPTLPTFGKTFLLDSGDADLDTCKLYFSISMYNSFSDISHAQVTVTYQNNNQSALAQSLYPSQLMLKQIKIDNTVPGEEKYYIEIYKTDLEEKKFEINTYYKVQIRFGDKDTSTPDGSSWESYLNDTSKVQSIDSWLTANLAAFSEWSTVCLIRGISTPTLNIIGLDADADYTIWQASNVDIVGSLSFKDTLEQDTLESYRIKLYKDNGELLVDSDVLYTEGYAGINEINYTLKRNFNDGELYKLEIEYTTATEYTDVFSFDFMIIDNKLDELDAVLTAELDAENGRIGINIKGEDNFIGNITIRRTSSKSNFTVWEDIYTFSIENEKLDYTWYDNTIESGVFYRYGAQKRTSLGNRGIINILDEDLILEYEDMYLQAEDKQLNIRFDPDISSFQYTVVEGKVDTLGGKYPMITRNGDTYYRQFPISGLITQFMDKDNLFTSKEDIYGKEMKILYDDYNQENDITPMYDVIYEKNFRDKVIDFLYKNNVKLFRSATEGNILVKLMNISFTPNKTLGRKIYSFSATAYEIDEASIENYDYYNIQTLGKIDDVLVFSEKKNNSININIPAGVNALDYINNLYGTQNEENYILTVDYLDYLKLEFDDEPYLITESSSGIRPFVDGDDPETAVLGHIAKINNKDIIIKAEQGYKDENGEIKDITGILELKGENVKITSLVFSEDTQIRLDYTALVTQKEDQSQLVNNSNFITKVGQLWGSFKINQSITKDIWNHFYQSYSTWYQSLMGINGCRIEADEGTIVYVKEAGEENFDKHIIGPTESLDFYEPDTAIEAMYFGGISLEEATQQDLEREILPSNKFIEIEDKYFSLEEITNPIVNGVYQIKEPVIEGLFFDDGTVLKNNTILINKNDIEKTSFTENENKYSLLLTQKTENLDRYIWYNGRWYPFTKDNEILCPVNASIDYIGEIVRGYYAK